MDFLNKAGILFTLTSLMAAGFFIIMFSADTAPPLDVGLPALGFRIDVVDRFRQSWEDFAEESLKAASYNALYRMSDFSNAQNLYYSDNPSDVDYLNSNFKNCLLNGTLEMPSFTYNCSEDGIAPNNYTIYYWLDTLADMAYSNLTMRLNYTIKNVSLYQRFPFSVTVEMNMSYEIIDVFATIRKNLTVMTEVPITGIRDPLPGAWFDWERRIKETQFRESEWNLQNLTLFVEREEYYHEPIGPSFLMRFTGNLGSSACCGLESVLSNRISGYGLMRPPPQEVKNSSYIDHMYFYDLNNGARFGCGDDVYVIDNGPPNNEIIDGVQLDTGSLAKFNITRTYWRSTACG